MLAGAGFFVSGLPASWYMIWLAIVGLDLYLLPTLIAAHRSSSTAAAAIVIDLLLGWTVVGWVAALALAVSGQSARQQAAGRRAP